MRSLRGEQRRVWFRRFFEQLEDAPGLLPVQPDDGLAFEDFLRLPVGGLHDKMVERCAFQVGGGLDGLAQPGGNAGDQTGLFFGDG